MVRIPDVLFFQEGPGVRNTQYTSSGVKLLNVANLQNGEIDLTTSERYISDEEANGRYKHFLVDEGDFIIASSGIKVDYFEKKMGFIKREHLPLCMNTSTIRFKVLDKDQLCLRYFMYYLKTNSFKKQLGQLITGSAQLNFGPSHLEKINIPFPPIETQKQIAKTLETAAELLTMRKQQLAELDNLIKSTFYDMFGDPVANEKGWDMKAIGDFSIVKIGPFGSLLHVEDYIEGGFPLVNPSHIVGSKIVPDIRLTLSTEKYNELKSYNMKKNDIIVGRRGEIGRCAIVEDEGLLCGTGSMFIRIESDYLPIMLQRIISSDTIRAKLEYQSVGVTMKNLNSGTISNLEVPMIPIHLQTQFATIVTKIEEQKSLVKKAIDETQYLFDSLMSEYVE